MSIDYTSCIGKLRAIINDTDEEELEYQDEQLEVFLELTNRDLLQSAVLALQGLISKYSGLDGGEYRIDTIEYKGPKSRASSYKQLLDSLKQSIADGTNPLLSYLPRTYGIYTWDRLENMQKISHGELIGPRTSDYEYEQIDLKPQYGPYYRG